MTRLRRTLSRDPLPSLKFDRVAFLRFGGIAALILVVASLAYLQVILDEKGLVYCLWAYGAVAFAALLASSRYGTQSFLDPKCFSATVIFVSYVVVRALTSPVSYDARFDLYLGIAAFTLYGICQTALSSATTRIAIMALLLLFAFAHVIVGVVQTKLAANLSMLLSSLENVEASQRATGLYVNPDHLAGLLEVLGVFGLSIVCWSRRPGWFKVIVGYLTIICYFGLVLSGSRAGYLSALFSLIIFAVLSLILLKTAGSRFLLKFGVSGVAVLLAVILITGYLMYQSIPLKSRLQNIGSDEGRLDLWHAAIEQWKLHPIVGTGSGTYRYYGRQFRTEQMQQDPVDVHNDYLHLLCEYGVLGGGVLAVFLGFHLRHGWRCFHQLGPQRLAKGSYPFSDRLSLDIGALCAIGAYMVHSSFDFNLHIPANALLLALVFGIVANPGFTLNGRAPGAPVQGITKIIFVTAAVILLVQSVRLLPGEYYTHLARSTLAREDPLDAILFTKKGIESDEHNPNTYSYLARGLIASTNKERGDDLRTTYKEALSAFEKARGLNPLDEAYPLQLGLAYDELGRYADAEPMYKLALKLDPRSRTVQNLYATHLELWNKARKGDVEKSP